MPGQPNSLRAKGELSEKRKRFLALQEENERLKALLELNEKHTLDSWMMIPTQEMRDHLAAQAWIAGNGQLVNALGRLGFDIDRVEGEALADRRARFKELGDIIFSGEAFHEIIERAFDGKLEEKKNGILGRLARIAEFGEDDAAIRAGGIIAKIAGWQETPDVQITRQTLNIFALDGQQSPSSPTAPAALNAAAMDFLGHEPGKPTRVTADDVEVVDAEFANVE